MCHGKIERKREVCGVFCSIEPDDTLAPRSFFKLKELTKEKYYCSYKRKITRISYYFLRSGLQFEIGQNNINLSQIKSMVIMRI